MNVTYDITAPAVNAGADRNSNTTFTQIGTVDADAHVVSWSKTSGPGNVIFGSKDAATTTLAASADGTYVIRLTATDKAGNSAYDEFTLTWWPVGPSFISLAKTNAASDGFINDSEKLTNSDLFILNAVGYTTASYSAPLPAATVCSSSVTFGATTMPKPSDLLADGTWVFCVELVDALGNKAYGKSDLVTRDTVFPVFTSLVGANAASDGYINASETSSTAALLALNASDQTTTMYTAVLADSALTCDASLTYGGATIPVINAVPGADGAYAVCVKLADAAGNTISV